MTNNTADDGDGDYAWQHCPSYSQQQSLLGQPTTPVCVQNLFRWVVDFDEQMHTTWMPAQQQRCQLNDTQHTVIIRCCCTGTHHSSSTCTCTSITQLGSYDSNCLQAAASSTALHCYRLHLYMLAAAQDASSTVTASCFPSNPHTALIQSHCTDPITLLVLVTRCCCWQYDVDMPAVYVVKPATKKCRQLSVGCSSSNRHTHNAQPSQNCGPRTGRQRAPQQCITTCTGSIKKHARAQSQPDCPTRIHIHH